MTIAAGMVDVSRGLTLIAAFDMPTQSGSTTSRDGAPSLTLTKIKAVLRQSCLLLLTQDIC
jgi:hypothetical protein